MKPVIWLTAVPIFTFADRPEVKNDAEATISSLEEDSSHKSNLTRSVFAELHTCPKALPEKYDNFEKSEWLTDFLYEETFHKLTVTSEMSTHPAKTIPHTLCRSKIFEVLSRTLMNEQLDTELDTDGAVVIQGKFLVPTGQEDFKDANKKMVEQTTKRCYGTRKFISGYVLQHVDVDEDINSDKWFYLHNTYTREGHPGCATANTNEDPTIYANWKLHRGNWLSLPTQINQKSPLLVSEKQTSVSVSQDLKMEMSARWLSCSGDHKPDSDTIQELFMHETDRSTYYIFQLYAANAKPVGRTPPEETISKNGETLKVQCRFQDLTCLAFKEGKKTIEFDDKDFIFHTEYEIRQKQDRTKFEEATTTLIEKTSAYHKQMMLFTSGEFNGNAYYHLFQVLDTPADLTRHQDSDGYREWMSIRKANPEWIKLTDGFSDNLELRITK